MDAERRAARRHGRRSRRSGLFEEEALSQSAPIGGSERYATVSDPRDETTLLGLDVGLLDQRRVLRKLRLGPSSTVVKIYFCLIN